MYIYILIIYIILYKYIYISMAQLDIHTQVRPCPSWTRPAEHEFTQAN